MDSVGENDKMFFYDEMLAECEKNFRWDRALFYLERLYSVKQNGAVLNTIVGNSWLYAVEGTSISGQYDHQLDDMCLCIWKKYIDIGETIANNDPEFCFIAGYTLSLHGFLIGDSYEKKGNMFIKKCLKLTNASPLHKLAENFVLNETALQRIHLQDEKNICQQIFAGNSLLEHYFTEIFEY